MELVEGETFRELIAKLADSVSLRILSILTEVTLAKHKLLATASRYKCIDSGLCMNAFMQTCRSLNPCNSKILIRS